MKRSGVYRSDVPAEGVQIDLGDKPIEAIARALGFPGWFGGNWDALEDCLCDLSWRQAQDGWVLAFQNVAAGEDFGVLVDILAAAAEYWRDRGKPFVAVFVDPQRRLALPEYAGAA